MKTEFLKKKLTVPKLQHEPHTDWSFTGVTAPYSLAVKLIDDTKKFGSRNGAGLKVKVKDNG